MNGPRRRQRSADAGNRGHVHARGPGRGRPIRGVFVIPCGEPPLLPDLRGEGIPGQDFSEDGNSGWSRHTSWGNQRPVVTDAEERTRPVGVTGPTGQRGTRRRADRGPTPEGRDRWLTLTPLDDSVHCVRGSVVVACAAPLRARLGSVASVSFREEHHLGYNEGLKGGW